MVGRIGASIGRFGRRKTGAVGGGSAPVNSVLPKFVDGLGNAVTAPVIGQRLFIDVGTWSGSPYIFTWQVYDDAGAVLDAYGTVSASSEQSYIVYDAEFARPLHVGVIASNGIPSLEASSANTSNVADRSLAKPALTRSSASGVTPMTFAIALPSGCIAGDQVHIQTCADNTFGTITQDIYHVLTEADLQSPFTPDWSNATPAGLVAPGATDYMHVFIETLTPQGRIISSPVSDAISPTDAVTAVSFSISDKSGATLSNANLTAALGGGGVAYARSTRGVSGKSYAEFRVDALSGTLGVGVSDPTEGSLTTNWAGDVDNLGVVANTDTSTHYGSTNHAGFAYGVGDVIGVHVDKPNGKVYFKKNNVNQLGGDPAAGTGGLPITATGNLLWIVQGYGGAPTVTGRFASADWSYAPASGYGATP